MPSRHIMRNPNESGVAMITTLLVLMLMSALLVGFTTVVISDQRYRFIDRDRGQAFYAAGAGIEKLTADVGNLFLQYVAPTATQVQNLTATMPSISGITFTAPQAPGALPASQLTDYHCIGRNPATNVPTNTKAVTSVGTNGYMITFCRLIATGNPTVSDDNLVISGTGAYAGMTALQSPYQLDVTAKTSTGGEVHLVRTMQAVAIPVFQFGIFSESDLSFFAEQNFAFGGRIHTNGNLWLGQFAGTTLTTTGRITAVGEVVRQFMANGAGSAGMGLTGAVSLATSAAAPTGNRPMTLTEGSVVGLPGSAATTGPPNWQSLSTGGAYYNGFIKTTATGAKRLTLPLTATGVGGTNVDLIRRPCITGAPAPCTGTADDVNSILYNERLFTKASLRILLSDTAADISNIPGVTATPPILLDNNWNTTIPNNGGAVAWGGVSAASGRPPIALSVGSVAMQTNAAVAVANPQNIGVSGAIPLGFQIAPLTVGGGGPFSQTPVTCTGRTLTTFTGCTAATNAAIAIGQPVTAVVNGQTVSTTLAASWVLNSTTITVPAGGTAPFANGVLWLKPNAVAQAGTTPAIGSPILVSCSGLQTASPFFQNCVGVTAAAANNAPVTTSALSNAGIGTIGGYIKIEKSNNAVPPVWTDVTMEILNYGFGGLNLGPVGQICNGGVEVSPNAIIRLQRLRDNPGGTPTTAGGGCFYAGDTTGWKNPANWWPNVLFDSREAVQRDADPNNAQTGLPLGGMVYYVTIDAKNLAKWFNAVAPYAAGSGGGSRVDNTGYTVYFSDRRNNRNAASLETGEFGWEDFVNPGVANGVPNGLCNLPAEDVNGNGTCETYGGTPNYNGAYNTNVPGASIPLTTAATPTTLVFRGQAQVNRPIIFRRALKLLNGATLGSDATAANRIAGLTVVSENPVYIQGDWNATAADFPPGAATLHAATSIIADSVTVLSNQWNDNFSFVGPYTYATGGRLRTAQSYYRFAVLAGKGINFASPSDIPAGSVFGTDGGPHNFLRMLEQDGGAATNTVNYRGSMASLFYNRQALGTFKCCSGSASDGIVYSVPVRNFFFDTDFLQPALLPPNTPMFRDLNVIGFSQELRPGR